MDFYERHILAITALTALAVPFLLMGCLLAAPFVRAFFGVEPAGGLTP